MSFARCHALSMGIGTYRDAPGLDVPITAADAEAVAAVLGDPDLCGYPPAQVQTLHDATATREGVLTALDRLALQAGEEDSVFLFYCGHGADGEDGDYYLTTHDTRVTGGRVVSGTGVRQGELIDRLRAIRAKRLLLLINACHSGKVSPVLGAVERTLADRALPAATAAALLATGAGRIIITACREEQIRQQFGQTQEPELTVLKGVGPFPVALYRGATELGAFDSTASIPPGMATREVRPDQAQSRLDQILRQRGDADHASIVGTGGTIAQGPGARAVAPRGVIVEGDNSGSINTGTRINTGGGAYVGGSVSVGGDFIGRDKIRHGGRTDDDNR